MTSCQMICYEHKIGSTVATLNIIMDWNGQGNAIVTSQAAQKHYVMFTL